MKPFTLTPIAAAITLTLIAGCSPAQRDVVSKNAPTVPVQAENRERTESRQELYEAKTAEEIERSDADLAAPAASSAQIVLQDAIGRSHAPRVKGSPVTPPALGQPVLNYSEGLLDREKYAEFDTNPVKSTAVDPLSSFGIDVDTASYSMARTMLNQGLLPRPESVRAEEWINYFPSSYPVPDSEEQPFSVTTEIAPAPWDEDRLLLSIGLKGYEVPKDEIPPLNLTFLIDVSGSMGSTGKLPLAINSLKMLTAQLRPQDRIAIVAYAGAAGLVLSSTPGNEKTKITNALDNLRAGGSTAGGAGIQLAYKVTREHHEPSDISRVILMSDGDFNVGTTGTDDLKKMVEHERKTGVQLSVMTFGRGNVRDELAQALAENGNGTAGYIDSAQEAKKLLVDGMAGTLMTIAKDTKAQVEFNPLLVSEYRLIGYETRHLEHHEFNDDTKDSGDLGAGHTVTAMYEVILHNSPDKLSPQLRYQSTPEVEATGVRANELAYLKLRYKLPKSDTSTLITRPIRVSDIKDTAETSDNFRWNAAVAAAGQYARGVQWLKGWSYEQSRHLANSAIGEDPYGHRAEFLRLMSLASSLDGGPVASASGQN